MIIKKKMIFDGSEAENQCNDQIYSNEDRTYFLVYLGEENRKEIFETENEAIESYLNYLTKKESFHVLKLSYYMSLKRKFAESLRKTSQ